MSGVEELRLAFEKRFGAALRDAAETAEDAVALKADRLVELVVEVFRDLGKANGLSVAPLRRGLGDLGWELVWGRNLQVTYAQLSRTPPTELFRLELVLEVVEPTLRPGLRPESAVEEVAADLGRLLWARSPLKVLFFGARREGEPANAIEALEAGLPGLVSGGDPDAEWLLAALPNLEGSRHAAPEKAVLWTKTVVRGRVAPSRITPFSTLLGSSA